MLRGVSIVLLAVVATSGAACGGVSSSQTLDPNARFYDLTPAEEGTFCDWEVSLFGGWDGGDVVSCGDAGQVPGHFGAPNQTACVEDLAQLSAKRQA
jgi:hypothetical protein